MAKTLIFFFMATFVVIDAANLNITSPPVTNWGIWGPHQRCPNGRYAQGFLLKTEPNQFLNDDTALNSILLLCGDPYDPETPYIKSTEGPFGDWGKIYSCYPGVLNGFQLRVEKPTGGDDTATNNVRFSCSSLSDPNDHIEGDGMYFGTWGESRHCLRDQGICGISTQVEPYQGSGDDTSLNNVIMECCDINQKEFDEQLKADQLKQMNKKHPLAALMRHAQTQKKLEH